MLDKTVGNSQKHLSIGAERALKVLKSGGYFRSLKSVAIGYEGKYYTTLRAHDGGIVPGAGYDELMELYHSHRVKYLDSSSMPTWVTKKHHHPDPREILFTLAYPEGY